MLTLWLIRHGETESNAQLQNAQLQNAQLQTQLQTSESSRSSDLSLDDLILDSLTECGKHQSTQIAQAVPSSPDLLVTSPLWRTKQTAQPTHERFPGVPQTEWLVQEFSYLAAGPYQAATFAQRRLLDQDYWQRSDPDYVSGDGAESFSSLMLRIKLLKDRLHQLAADPEANFVLIFSHAWFIRAVVWSLVTQSTEISPRQMERLHHFAGGVSVPNGSICKVQVDASEIWLTGISTAHLNENSAPLRDH